jgi:ADP-heptose:LPS heptosyltransferase
MVDMPRTYLLVRLSAIGDVINALPSLSLLRRAEPDARIVFVVEDKAKDAVVGHPDADQVIVFPRRRWSRLLRSGRIPTLLGELAGYLRRLRREKIDVSLDLQGNLKGALHSLLSGAPRRLGFSRGHTYELNHWFSTEQVEPPADRPHRVEKFASLLGPLGISGALLFRLPATDAAAAPIDSYLKEIGLDRRPFVVLHPGTSGHGTEKRWPPDRFGRLAERIVEELKLGAVVTWGPGEEPLAREVCLVSRNRAKLGPRTASLLELAELIRRSTLFVSGDTGPMHLAGACGVRCLALFGPKNPDLYRPYGPRHTVIYRPGPDLTSISVEEVFGAVAQDERIRAL